MASGGSSGRAASGSRSFDFGSDDVLCSYDDYASQDPNNGKRSEPSGKDFHESRRPLINVYGQQEEYPKEEIIPAVEKCMKKYADNLLRFLEGISGRLSQLELYCYKLERSIGEFRADMIRDQNDADMKLKSLEKHLQEVHRSIQILRDKQELAETQKELTKLQLVPKEPTTPSHSQKSDAGVSASPKRADDVSEMPNQQLALVLPHQTPSPPSLPIRAPDQNQQLPMQQQQLQQLQPVPASLNMPQDRYVLNQIGSFYPQQSQTLPQDQQGQALQQQSELQYMQPQRPQMQDLSVQAPLPPQQQQQQAQPSQQFPQYQQQWSQLPPQQQLPQQALAPQQITPQPVISRPQSPSPYPPYPPHQSSANPTPETFPSYSATPQSSRNRPDNSVTFGPSGSSTISQLMAHHNLLRQSQHQVSQNSFGPPPMSKGGGYMGTPIPYTPLQPNAQGYSNMYSIDGGRGGAAQTFRPSGSYTPLQSQQLPGSVHHPGQQLMHSQPFAEIIDKAISMGYPRDQVVAVINRMLGENSGQPIDFNALLDRLNVHAAAAAAAGPPRAWSG